MTQSPFDRLAKQYLGDFLPPIGTVDGLRSTRSHREYETPGESEYMDVWFMSKSP